MVIQSPLWAAFFSNKTTYKKDKSRLNAWCRVCLDHVVAREKEAQTLSIAQGAVPVARTDKEWDEIGITKLQPISERPETMRNHLYSCEIIQSSPELRQRRDEVIARTDARPAATRSKGRSAHSQSAPSSSRLSHEDIPPSSSSHQVPASLTKLHSLSSNPRSSVDSPTPEMSCDNIIQYPAMPLRGQTPGSPRLPIDPSLLAQSADALTQTTSRIARNGPGRMNLEDVIAKSMKLEMQAMKAQLEASRAETARLVAMQAALPSCTPLVEELAGLTAQFRRQSGIDDSVFIFPDHY